MKKLILLTIISMLLCATGSFAQSNADIASIRSSVAAINKSAKRYKKTTLNVEGISLEGTEATYFTSGRGLHKITAGIYGETFYVTAEYFYSGEELLFIFERFSRYKSSTNIPGGTKVVSTEERRYYFQNGEVIRLMVGKGILKADNERYADLRDTAVGTAGKLKEAYLQNIN